ncbi:MAG: recombinase family protein [Candidatus Peribacter sp.]|nr:recombinase family protein [Candidatus Peribacter sp.]
MKYFLYCRKSQDREDKQILSTDAQKRLLTEFAERLHLTVVDMYVENQTAYKIGRPMFNAMLTRLEAGEADAILTYHLTRLARNSFDGGRIIYLMDEGTVKEIRTPESIFVNKSDDKFMMQIHFAMAKKSSDDTSQFVCRDIISKLLKGEYPGVVPLGYLNVDRAGRIAPTQYQPEKQRLLEELGRPLRREEIDPVDSVIVRKIWEEAAKGTRTFLRLAKFAHDLGLRTRSGKNISKATIYYMLTNPYYYGAIRFDSKLYTEDVQHEPLITRSLFEHVQDVMCTAGKGNRRKHDFDFKGMLKCGECGCAITVERQRGHVYYHCTRNRPCTQSVCSKEKNLEERIMERLSEFRIIPREFLVYASKRVRVMHKEAAGSVDALRNRLERKFGDLKQRLDALLQLKLSPKNTDGRLISDDEYVEQKMAVRVEMQGIEEQIRSIKQEGNNWMDDCERFVESALCLDQTLQHATMEQKKELLVMVASNILLKDGNVAITYRDPYAAILNFAKEQKPAFERGTWLAEAENGNLMEKWLLETVTIKKVLLDVTYCDALQTLAETALRLFRGYRWDSSIR